MRNAVKPLRLNNLPAETIKVTIKVAPEKLLEILNHEFPDCWKVVYLVLEKNVWQRNNIRPICSLNALSKLHESFIRLRVQEELGNETLVENKTFWKRFCDVQTFPHTSHNRSESRSRNLSCLASERF